MRKPTQKEIDNFINYRANHVALVQKLGNLVFGLDFSDHDSDKINANGKELELFALRQAYKKDSTSLSNEDRNTLRKVSAKHALNSRHHAEFWDKSISIKNFKEDDSNIIAPKKMPNRYITEMACDWTACALYHNEPIFKWYNKTINNTLFLTKSQNEHLVNCLNKLEKAIIKNNITFPTKKYNCEQYNVGEDKLIETDTGYLYVVVDNEGRIVGNTENKDINIVKNIRSILAKQYRSIFRIAKLDLVTEKLEIIVNEDRLAEAKQQLENIFSKYVLKEEGECCAAGSSEGVSGGASNISSGFSATAPEKVRDIVNPVPFKLNQGTKDPFK